MPIILMNKQKSDHFWISTKKWQKMMHALWGNTTTTVTTKPVGRPKGVAKAKAKAKGSLTHKLDPSGSAKPTPPTPPKPAKKVTFAAPGASSPASAPSGRARLINLVGTALTTEPYPETAFTRYLGEVTMAGQDAHTEATELAKNLQILGQGLKSGSFKNDIADTEFAWMSGYVDALEQYLSAGNKKKNASTPSGKSILSPASKLSVKSTSPSGTLMDKFFPEESVEYAKSQAFEYKAPSDGEANTRHAAKFDSSLRDNATKNDYREWRLMSQAFVDTQAELKILESSVRDSLISSLGASTRQAVLAQFGSKLSSKRVVDLIHYLDMRLKVI